jgi:DNA-binding transcriptional regulator YhcF (GntR family)
MTEAPHDSKLPRDVAARWTPTIAKLGWTPISIFFLDNYHRLVPPIKYSEAMFVIHLMRYKWDDNAPFPSFGTLAEKMNVSPEAVRSYARSLQKKGYLYRENQIGLTNRFHLDKLFTALEVLAAKDKLTPKTSTRRLLSQIVEQTV